MSSHTHPILSAGEILALIAVFPLLVGKIVTFIVTSSWLHCREGSFSRRQWRRNVAASVNTVISVLKPRQVRALVKHTTGEEIERYCATRHLSHQPVLVLNDDGFPPATLHFVDCGFDQKGPILLYFHGGGYIAPLLRSGLQYAASLARAAGASLVLLEYALAPECIYPGQLSQAIAALRLLLHHHDPSNIILSGESAGANLVLAVMAHLQESKTGISPLDLTATRNASAKFRGVLAISPRTANDPTAESFRYNNRKDSMNKNSLCVITQTWRPEDDVWAAPVLARAGFWDGMRAEYTLLVVGGNEVYHDDVCHVAQVMSATEDTSKTATKSSLCREKNPELQLIVCPGEIHCQANSDHSLGITDGHMARGVAEWLSRL